MKSQPYTMPRTGLKVSVVVGWGGGGGGGGGGVKLNLRNSSRLSCSTGVKLYLNKQWKVIN